MATKRSYPMSEVRGSGREYQTAMAQERPRGATLRSSSAGEAERRYPVSEVRGRREEILHAPNPRPGAAARRSNPMPEARGGGQEDQPHVHGAVAARAQEVLEELPHVEGKEGWQ